MQVFFWRLFSVGYARPSVRPPPGYFVAVDEGGQCTIYLFAKSRVLLDSWVKGGFVVGLPA